MTMLKAVGAFGECRREFESDFIKYCQDQSFSPGFECARMLDIAAKSDDAKTFGFLLGIANRTLTESGHVGDNPQGSLLIEWKDGERATDAA